VKRLLEEGVVSFLVAFGGVFTATDGGLTVAAATAGVAAGLRALYGVFVKNVGEDANKPSAS
jgi:hypothetical protein